MTEKIVCQICGYGDGKWQDRQGKVLPQTSGHPAGREMKWPCGLPICEKCKADGWTDDPAEVQRAILDDPLLKDVIDHQI